MLKVIGGEQEGEFKAVASGTLPNGKPVVVNSDGTVSVVEQTASTFGTSVVYESAATANNSTVYDSTNNRIIISYYDGGNSGFGTSVVGTVNPSDNSITFGTPVTWETGSDVSSITSVYHPSTNTVFIAYRYSVTATKIVVGEVSGNSITFGTASTITGNPEDANLSACHDVASDKIVLFSQFTGNPISGRARVITITSKDSQSWGSPVNFSTSTGVLSTAAAYDAANQKSVVLFRDNATTKIVAGTVSGTSITFDTISTVASTGGTNISLGYDASSEKLLALYYNSSATDMKARVCDASGSSVTFGTEAVLYTANSGYSWVTYDSSSSKLLAFYTDFTDGYYKEATISGTSVTFGSAVAYNSGSTQFAQAAVDTSAGRVVAGFRDQTNSSYGEAVVIAIDPTTLTAENYIGMSRGTLKEFSQSESVGSSTAFLSGETSRTATTYDASQDKIIVAYRDNGNFNYGTVAVGTVTGSSISFGTPVVFKTATVAVMQASYDSANNKIVIAYRDGGNSNYGTAIVGTVSGTSISFGSPVVFQSSASTGFDIAFDSSTNQNVISYVNSATGQSAVILGTVSGTSISFGSATTVTGANTTNVAYDSTNNKVVLSVYATSGSPNDGIAYVGTVSGTSISFGSGVTYKTNVIAVTGCVFDASTGKIVVGYGDGGTNDMRCKVGTVSGTSISFGSEINVGQSAGGGVGSLNIDTSVNKVVYSYKDNASPYKGVLRAGAISGTSITFDTEFTFETGEIGALSSGFDSTSRKMIISYNESGGAQYYGKSVAYQPAGSYQSRGEVASGQPAAIDIIGSVNDIQESLTSGEKYYVQTDGTLSTTAGSPSVLAGTAISATKLVVKT